MRVSCQINLEDSGFRAGIEPLRLRPSAVCNVSVSNRLKVMLLCQVLSPHCGTLPRCFYLVLRCLEFSEFRAITTATVTSKTDCLACSSRHGARTKISEGVNIKVGLSTRAGPIDVGNMIYCRTNLLRRQVFPRCISSRLKASDLVSKGIRVCGPPYSGWMSPSMDTHKPKGAPVRYRPRVGLEYVKKGRVR
ncbi:hypothetical protein EVAR_31905_1 [Eumeta japonica]|uniref:Uncharacterized protein n=1 Tax=Eumeta variegata TaxID=151549 RepID=A0A4C1XP12_EUMVA|nr:hypothetical protein EVAR_31905_1 [Eumeta japonica]